MRYGNMVYSRFCIRLSFKGGVLELVLTKMVLVMSLRTCLKLNTRTK
ncbi:hypothetical protein Desgi_0996 [Desulfoscipio gibsoniae DSM 7213]|uniref:Uncharacterized protein n=1 Tax=Desulfoscipio gibsoniae DSM 7213 TaxID=767817 RepID=R4KLP0_9FIRM|nr:hypothetical protein Desgi_0996 [Desulfoscipio gibsoniae DSM 7213]